MNKGFTIIEIVMVVLVGGVVLIVASMFLARSFVVSRQQVDQVRAVDDARIHLGRGSELIKGSVSWDCNDDGDTIDAGENWLTKAEPYEMVFRADSDKDGDYEQLRYFVEDGSRELKLGVKSDPCDSEASEDVRVVLSTVDNRAQNVSLFRYYAAGVGVVSLEDPVLPAAVERVELSLNVDAHVGVAPDPVEVSVSATPRLPVSQEEVGSPALPESTLVYWKLDDRQGGDVAADSSPNGNDAVYGNKVAGSNLVADVDWKFPNAASVFFDGRGDRIVGPNMLSDFEGDEFTVSLWVNVQQNIGGITSFLGEDYYGSFGVYTVTFGGQDDVGQVDFKIFTEDGDTLRAFSASDAIEIGQGEWYNIVGRADGERASLFINGEKVADSSNTYGQPGNGLASSSGNYKTAINNVKVWYKGSRYNIDEVRFFERALGDDEILRISEGEDVR